MATEQRRAAIQGELRDLSDCGATLPELLNHLEEQDRLNGRSRFSDDQEEELQLYCWALHKGQSSGLLVGQSRAWGGLEDDIGA
jgi:hypothetical protein